MRQFLTQILVCNFFAFFLVSCKTYQPENLTKVISDKKEVENLYFSSSEDYVYKCQMEVYGNDISGIVILKKINNDKHRVVMTTDFGNKMIDFEISATDFKLNYVLPDLDKKMVINFLKNDFQLLLKKQFPISKKFENPNAEVFVSNLDADSYYLFFNKDTKLLSQIVYTKNKKEKIDFNFDAKNPIFADNINIQHKDFKIKINLTQITKEN